MEHHFLRRRVPWPYLNRWYRSVSAKTKTLALHFCWRSTAGHHSMHMQERSISISLAPYEHCISSNLKCAKRLRNAIETFTVIHYSLNVSVMLNIRPEIELQWILVSRVWDSDGALPTSSVTFQLELCTQDNDHDDIPVYGSLHTILS
jgi:hypothetical protein